MAEPFQVQGWCPGAWQPMRAADGWLVRVRPRCATLAMAQWRVLAQLALEYAHPQVELTRLGNVQLRGVADAALAPLRRELIEHGLVPAEADADLAPPVHCTPFHHAGDPTHALAQALADAVDRHLRPGALQAVGLAALPSKFGLLVDDPQRRLGRTAADVRAWARPEGGFALGLGRTLWRFAGVDAAVDAALHAARWFAAERMRHARPPTRLHALLDVFPPPAHWGDGVADEAAAGPVPPGPQGAFGHLLGVPLGRADARALLALADLLPPDAQMRVTPWRSLLIHPADAARAAVAALRASSSSAWAFDAGDARLRVSACTGAPCCTQALGATQPLALRLAAQVPPGRHVHVSGCDKHCALPPEADALVGATAGGGWAVVPARAGGLPDEPLLAGIAPFLNTRSMTHTYETDGDAIYRQSFAIIRSEADLARFNAIEERVVCRMIHAAGLVALANDVAFAPGFANAAEAALQAGAPVLCDARMVSEGITRKRLPAGNEVICTLNDPRVPGLARQMGNTRSAAALELWRPHLAGAVVAIGNAPTALFHLLNMLQDPACPRPAAIVGCPVGFVGAAESKEALSEWDGVPWLVVRGRLGGSAVTVAAINALASPAEWGQAQPVRAEAAQ